MGGPGQKPRKTHRGEQEEHHRGYEVAQDETRQRAGREGHPAGSTIEYDPRKPSERQAEEDRAHLIVEQADAEQPAEPRAVVVAGQKGQEGRNA